MKYFTGFIGLTLVAALACCLYYRAPDGQLHQLATLEEQRDFLSRDLRRKRLLHALFPVDDELAFSLKRLAEVHRDLGAYEDAEELFQDALDMHRTMRYEDGIRIAYVKADLAWLYHQMGDTEHAKMYFDDAIYTLNDQGFGIGSTRLPAFLPSTTAEHIALLFELYGRADRAGEVRKKLELVNARMK